MRIAFLLFLGVVAVAPIATVMACTVSANVGEIDAVSPDSSLNDDGRATSADGAIVGDDGAAIPNPTNDSGADTSTPPATTDAGCGVAFAHPAGSNFVDVQVIMGPMPNPNGGPVVAGMYALTTMRSYYPGQMGTMQVRETIRVRGSSTAGAFDILTEARSATGDFKAYPLHGETITWMTGAGPAMFVTPECPKKDFQKTSRFDAEGDTLMLFDDDKAIERIYRRVP